MSTQTKLEDVFKVRHPKLLFKNSFKWERGVEDFVKSRIIGRSINVPCGMSQLGDVRVDIDPTTKPTVLADFLTMNLAEIRKLGPFTTVIEDPPWGINFYHRRRWFFRAVDLCEVGGIIIHNAPWIPESKAVAEIEAEQRIRQSAHWGNVSVLSVFKKINGFTCDKPAIEPKESPH